MKNTFQHYSNGAPSRSSSSPKKGKSDYCWILNKGVPCKFGNRCKFVERCKYCDSPAHGVYACPKLAKKGEGKNPVQESGGNNGTK